MMPYLHAWCSCRKGDLDCISACKCQHWVFLIASQRYTYFRCLQAPHERGTRFLLRTTLNCGSGGDCPALEELVEGGVGGILR